VGVRVSAGKGKGPKNLPEGYPGYALKLVDSCKNDPGANLHQSVAANIAAALSQSKLDSSRLEG
jgi:hypothetical protein